MKKLIKEELIGCDATIISARNKGLTGITGKIVDETKNLLIIRSGEKHRKVLKKGAVFCFKIGKKLFRVSGDELIARPWERTKKHVMRKRW